MSTKILIILTIFFFSNCNQQSNIHSINKNLMDTLKLDNNNSKVLEVVNSDYTNSYYLRFGILIQKYYEITDSLSIDLNSDKQLDNVLVVSPICLSDSKYYSAVYDSLPKRLFVEVLNENGKSKIRHIYRNLISDIGGVLFNYTGIKTTKEGISITHEAGNKFAWQYGVELSVEKKDSLIIKKIFKECSYENQVFSEEYSYDNLSVVKFNVNDTIKNNCGCDKNWSLLMKKENK